MASTVSPPISRDQLAVDIAGSTWRSNVAKARDRQVMYGLVRTALSTAGITENLRDEFVDIFKLRVGCDRATVFYHVLTRVELRGYQVTGYRISGIAADRGDQMGRSAPTVGMQQSRWLKFNGRRGFLEVTGSELFAALGLSSKS